MSAQLRVVVVTYHPGPELAALLTSLAAACSIPYEVVLADNGGTAPVGGATVLDTGGNIGYGRAANAGAAGFGGSWLLVANPDLWLAPGSIDTLLAAADRWPEAAAFGPAILTPTGELYPSARALPSLARGAGHALLGWCWPSNPWTASYRREQGAAQEGPTGWLSGACLLVRRRDFEAIGGFDPAYFMYFEDTDLGRRLGARRSVYVPSAVVRHEGGVATSSAPREMLKAHHRSAFRYLRREYPWLAPLLALGLALRYLIATVVPALGAGAVPTRGVEALPLEAPGVEAPQGTRRASS